MSYITIKGNKDGLTVYINANISYNYDDIKNEILERLNKGRDFFKNNFLTIIDKSGNLTPDDYNNLSSLLKNDLNITLRNTVKENKIENINEKVFQGITEGKTKFVKNTVRSGQRINYNGNVVIIGDVNSGAEVVASGNIVVMGVLRGIAHAGCNGNRRAIVSAYILQASQLRIADIITRAPDDYKGRPLMPEIAKIKENTIVIEPYLPNKQNSWC